MISFGDLNVQPLSFADFDAQAECSGNGWSVPAANSNFDFNRLRPTYSRFA